MANNYKFPSPLHKIWLNWTLKTKLGFSFAVLTFFISIIFSLIVGQQVKHQVEKEQTLFLQQINRELLTTFQQGMLERYKNISNIAVLSEFRSIQRNDGARRVLLNQLQESYDNYAWIGFANDEGIVEVSTQKMLEGVDVSERPWFVEGLQSSFVGDVHDAKLLGKILPPPDDGDVLRLLDISTPVYDNNEQLIGVLGAHLSWEWVKSLEDSLMRNIGEEQEVDILIVSEDGDILLNSGEKTIFDGGFFLESASGNNGYVTKKADIDGSEYLISYGVDDGYLDYPGLGWRVVIKKESAIAFRPAYNLQIQILLWGLFLASIASVVGWKIADRITKPLLNLSKQAKIITEGNRETPIKVYQGKDAIALLSSSLNELAHTLLEQEKSLKEINQKLEQKVEDRTKELEKAKEMAEKANRAKSEFLSSMSHELRTPLNAILGFAQLMEDDQNLSPENKENLTIISTSGKHLLSLINDVLDLSKIEAGEITLNENLFNIREMLASIESMLQIKATEKNLQLKFLLQENLPEYIITDEGKLRQVLLNLLSNSIKFTKKGTVSLCAELSNPQTLHFRIEDTGVGIAPDEMSKLFSSFFQSQSGRQSQQGTGLGLIISQEFIHLMGGSIQVTSVINKGSIFDFTISFSPAQANPKIIQPIEDNHQKLRLASSQSMYRILVVDDNESNRKLLTKLLIPVGFQVKQAEDGIEAIARTQKWYPHLILMDIGMPNMNGDEATKIIKKWSHENNQSIIIIALTAHAFMEEKQAILASGCDDIISKPFSHGVLLNKLKHYLNLEYTFENSRNINRDTVIDKETYIQLDDCPKILIAEDNQVNQKLLISLIKKIGYKVDVANNGVEVISALEKREYDLIFMDMEMPIMDGLEATQKIYQVATREKKLPVVVAMTANDDDDSRGKCFDVGMSDYLTKPINFKQLDRVIKKYVVR
ncbi:MAG: response regulator [Cyanobacterium sp.]